MNKMFAMLFIAFAMLTSTSYAGLTGLGWNSGTDQLTARLGSNLDLGVGGVADENNHVTLSADYLGCPLAASEGFTAHTVVGLNYSVDSKVLGGFVGVMPELVFNKHLAISTRFGLSLPLYNDGLDLHFNLTGQPVSLVNGLNFKVLF